MRKLTFFSRPFDRSTGIAEGKSSAFAERARMGCANARGARCEMRSRGGTRVDELSARAENGQAARRVVASSCPGPVTAPRVRFAIFERTFERHTGLVAPGTSSEANERSSAIKPMTMFGNKHLYWGTWWSMDKCRWLKVSQPAQRRTRETSSSAMWVRDDPITVAQSNTLNFDATFRRSFTPKIFFLILSCALVLKLFPRSVVHSARQRVVTAHFELHLGKQSRKQAR